MLQDPKTTEPQAPADAAAGEQVVVQPANPPEGTQTEKVQKLSKSPEYLWTVGLLAVVMLGGAIAIGILDKWRRRQVLPGRWENAGQELNTFKEMLESGEITRSEYEKIRDKVATKIKIDSGLKKLPTQPPPASNPSASSPPAPEPPPAAPPSEKT